MWFRALEVAKYQYNSFHFNYKVGDINFAIINVDNESTVTYRQLKFLDSEYYAYQPMYWVGGKTNDTGIK